jgi:DNA-binding NarL/FixJ family response regulator
MADVWMTIKQAADLLRVPARKLRHACQTGAVPSRRMLAEGDCQPPQRIVLITDAESWARDARTKREIGRPGLRRRTAELFDLHSQGMTDEEVARELGIKERSVARALQRERRRSGKKTVANLKPDNQAVSVAQAAMLMA